MTAPNEASKAVARLIELLESIPMRDLPRPVAERINATYRFTRKQQGLLDAMHNGAYEELQEEALERRLAVEEILRKGEHPTAVDLQRYAKTLRKIEAIDRVFPGE